MKDYTKLSDSITHTTDEMKYFLNCTKDMADNKEVTPAYLEKLEELYNSCKDFINDYTKAKSHNEMSARTEESEELYYSCKDFINAYEYYTQAKYYECANADEMFARTKEYLESFKK